MKWSLKEIWRRLHIAYKRYTKDRSWRVFALFVVFATLLWWGHASNSVRERNLIVPVAWIGIPDDICFSADLPQTLTIRLRDQGSRLSHYRHHLKSGITIDLQDYRWQADGHLHIAPEHIRSLLTDFFQGTARVQQITPECIDRPYARQQSKVVPIHLHADMQTAKQYDFLQPLSYEPQDIKIFGGQAALDSTAFLSTTNLMMRDLKTSGTCRVALSLPTGIRAECDSITVSYNVEQYTEKVFQLPITITSASSTIMLLPQVAEVVVRVPISKFQEVNEQHLNVVCDYPTKPIETLPLRIETNSPYILSSRINPQEVEYIIVN